MYLGFCIPPKNAALQLIRDLNGKWLRLTKPHPSFASNELRVSHQGGLFASLTTRWCFLQEILMSCVFSGKKEVSRMNLMKPILAEETQVHLLLFFLLSFSSALAWIKMCEGDSWRRKVKWKWKNWKERTWVKKEVEEENEIDAVHLTCSQTHFKGT